MKDLQLALNGVYFDQIRKGDKVEEFRLRTDYWTKRLVGRQYRDLVLTRGYPKGGGIERVSRLTMAYQGYRETTLTHPHFGPDPVDVFAISSSYVLYTEAESEQHRRDMTVSNAHAAIAADSHGYTLHPRILERLDPEQRLERQARSIRQRNELMKEALAIAEADPVRHAAFLVAARPEA